MSSEMRDEVQRVVDSIAEFCDADVMPEWATIEHWRDLLREALLARTEAGADGAAAYRWLDDLREQMAHCVSAADEGVDYAVSRGTLDAMTTLGLMEKVGRGRWAPTNAGRDFAHAKPTLPVEIYGKFYEVPIPVQLHIVNLRDKITHPQDASGDAEDAARWRHVRKDGLIWRVNMLALAKDDIDILFGAKADAAVDDAMQAKEAK